MIKLLPALSLLATLGLFAQGTGAKLDPIQWSAATPAQGAKGGEVLLKVTAKMEGNWHLYSLTTPRPPIATTIRVDDHPALESYRVFQPAPVRKLDPNFGVETETFEKEVSVYVLARLKPDAPAGPVDLNIKARYQACSDTQCLNPRTKTAAAQIVIGPGDAKPAQLPDGFTEVAVKPAAAAASGTTAPVPAAPPAASEEDWLPFLLTAFSLGLASIFTPCVFPMIPFVMSGFLNRDTGSRGQGIFQAALFCLGIIVLFCAIGFAITAALGPFGVVQLGSNPWVNAFIAALFLTFGLSLLGAFEITMPAWLTSKVDNASRQGGSVGTLLMSLSFALTSFACVGPFVGTVLAGSIQAKGARPALGMFSFATGLAAPFFLLALFPQYLKRLPKSGGWLARVKVVMGFIVLAALVKYLSNIDAVLQLGWITRERFLAAWFVFFAMAGLYLLGLIRLEGVKPDEHMGVGRLLTAAGLLIFAFSLLPGMFGGRLGELDAHVPPPSESAAAQSAQASGNKWYKNNYREVIAKAKQENKLVLINFTGYACTNCHWMKQNMFPRPQVQEALADLLLIELYTDGTDAISEENAKMELDRFQSVAVPFYAIVDGDEKVHATFDRLTKNTEEFVKFLKTRQS